MINRLRRLALLLAWLAPIAGYAFEPPHLIVVISVDQFSADLFAEYRGAFSGGLKTLSQGAVFPSAYQSHAATETCPGHSTILTGVRPARSGIIANEWIDLSLARDDKEVYCAEDPTIAGSSSTQYTVSDQYLKAQTLGDRMKAVDPRSRVVAVAGKDRAAIMMGGHAIDQVWFWGRESYVTLADRNGPVPASLARVNRSIADLIAHPRPSPLPPQCRMRSAAFDIAGRQVGVLTAAKPGDIEDFRLSTRFDRSTADLAIGLIDEMKLGQGASRDLIAIGLSATDFVGHAFGTQGAEMCAQLMALDQTIDAIMAALERSKTPYIVVLTADHGGSDIPERNLQRGVEDTNRLDPALNTKEIAKHLAGQLGLSGPILVSHGASGNIYVDHSVPVERRTDVIAAAKARYLTFPQVAGVFTAAELQALPAPQGSVDEWSLAERLRASFDPERSGDLVVALKPRVNPISRPKATLATHGSPWNYDRRVPLIFYRPGMTGFEQPLPVETVDIMPTLAALIALPYDPADIDGRCLDLDPSAANSCRPR